MSLAIPESVKIYSQFIHPVVMWILLATAIYALYLGIKIRQTRNAEGETKKELLKGRYNIRHYQVGSVLLAFMVISPIFAMAITYINNGKLILSPHLIVGLTTVSLIASSASLAPFMQKGNMWARNIHFALNIGVLGLFAWQVVTGIQIVQKIISKL
ncbi:DUF4079 domain-containing protein [Pleurocapsales cyanobacterium LEGE 06147]|nr:DUF4079 domain-containing protein [Pleurocapsales cyanobacterium LEGE 06147]